MRALLLIGLLAIPASAAPLPAPSAPLYSTPDTPERAMLTPPVAKGVINPHPESVFGRCAPTAAQMAADRARKNGGALLHTLTKLPPANQYLAVDRQIDGCEAPIVVAYGLGASQRAAHK